MGTSCLMGTSCCIVCGSFCLSGGYEAPLEMLDIVRNGSGFSVGGEAGGGLLFACGGVADGGGAKVGGGAYCGLLSGAA